ncbi:hypothetical protein [Paenibacillus albus]|uniref:Uncharacterized protein n=1 Tax=Paenibacillus albus TaxID=2495582 RepID=A0A3Q8X3V1_9BACL|nr:hypothetical protein [Paenibacillus albus]AZN39537.1 hypothetical protein EJC50_07575 [Paenibacillus albus]
MNNKWLDMTIYLNSSLINSYNKKKQLLGVLERLTTYEGEIRCYFVGVYPQLKRVNLDGNEFETVSITIENLDHLVFRFDYETE